MTTTQKRTIKATHHVRKAERFLGGPLEETLKPYLNERGTMSELANAIGVQKATVNYWIMKLGIKYARVAYDEGEVVRVMSIEEAELADAAIESGLDADDFEHLDGPTLSEYAQFKANDSGDVQFANLTPQDLKLLETFKKLDVVREDFDEERDIPACLEVAVKLSEQGISPRQLGRLTRSGIVMLSELKGIGATQRDIKMLDGDSFRHLREMWDKGLEYEDYSDLNLRKLKAFNRVEAAGLTLDQVASISKNDLEMLERMREVGWDDAAKVKEDQELLKSVREVGLDDPRALEAYRNFKAAASA